MAVLAVEISAPEARIILETLERRLETVRADLEDRRGTAAVILQAEADVLEEMARRWRGILADARGSEAVR